METTTQKVESHPDTRQTGEMRTARKALHYVCSGQFRHLFLTIGERMPSWLFRRGAARLFEMHNLSDFATIEATDTDCGEYRIGEVTREGLAACAAMAGHPAAEFLRRHDYGDCCIAAFFGQRPVHITWLHFDSCYVRGLDLLLQLDDTVCYTYGGFTDPTHRGKGLFKRVHQEILRLLVARGASRVVAVIVEGNQVPAVMCQKLGYRLTGVIRHVTVCGIRKTVIADPSHGWRVRQLRWRRPAGVFWI